MVSPSRLTCRAICEFRHGVLLSSLALAIGLLALLGCEAVPCRQASDLAEIRACYCEMQEPADDSVPGDGALNVEEQARLERGLDGLASPNFEDYARAGEELVSLGRKGFSGLLCAPVIRRQVHDVPQDPVDRVLLVLLAQEFPAGERAALLVDPEPMRRLYAVRSIRFRRAIDETADLIAAMDDENYHVREEAIEAVHALAGESRIRKPRNVLYHTPRLRQAREVKRWKSRWRRDGVGMYDQAKKS